MSQAIENHSFAPGSDPLLPRYRAGDSEREALACFASGATLAVERGRARAYPGLATLAPNTLPLYGVAHLLPAGEHALDLGSGAGMGVRVLTSQFRTVTAVDRDEAALAFARQYSVGAGYIVHDLMRPLELPAADAVFSIDVLGHVDRPEALLQTASRSLKADGRLVLAEARAHVSQRLSPPARRAFSTQELEQLLVRCGLELETWICDQGTFLCGLARRSRVDERMRLLEAMSLLDDGQNDAALSLLENSAEAAEGAYQLEALLSLADVLLQLGDGDGAASAYLRARESYPDDARPLAGLAHIQLLVGLPNQALGLAVEALRRNPTNAMGATLAAVASEELGHPDAFNAWRVAVNLAPDSLDAASGLARVASQPSHVQLALATLDRLRAYGDPLGAPFHIALGTLLMKAGRLEDASLEARLAASLAPRDPAVLALLVALSDAGAPTIVA